MATSWLTVPNIITLLRLVLIPVFVVLHVTGRPGWALAVFVIASVSDGIDGFLARVLDQRSKFGAFLDPVADKLLVFAALITLSWSSSIPWWFLGLIIFRDGTMIVGAVMVRRKGLELPSSPSRIGKYATFTSICFIVLALLAQQTEDARLAGYTQAVGLIAALCIVISTTQYFVRFGYLFFAPPRVER